MQLVFGSPPLSDNLVSGLSPPDAGWAKAVVGCAVGTQGLTLFLTRSAALVPGLCNLASNLSCDRRAAAASVWKVVSPWAWNLCPPSNPIGLLGASVAPGCRGNVLPLVVPRSFRGSLAVIPSTDVPMSCASSWLTVSPFAVLALLGAAVLAALGTVGLHRTVRVLVFGDPHPS